MHPGITYLGGNATIYVFSILSFSILWGEKYQKVPIMPPPRALSVPMNRERERGGGEGDTISLVISYN